MSPGIRFWTLSMALMGSNAGSAIEPLTPEQLSALASQKAACVATIATSQGVLVHIENARAVTFVADGIPLAGSVLFQGGGKKGPEVKFSRTDGNINHSGTLTKLKSGAHLTIVFTAQTGVQSILFDGPVAVSDSCANDDKKRLFQKMGWIEKAIWLGAGH